MGRGGQLASKRKKREGALRKNGCATKSPLHFAPHSKLIHGRSANKLSAVFGNAQTFFPPSSLRQVALAPQGSNHTLDVFLRNLQKMPHLLCVHFKRSQSNLPIHLKKKKTCKARLAYQGVVKLEGANVVGGNVGGRQGFRYLSHDAAFVCWNTEIHP